MALLNDIKYLSAQGHSIFCFSTWVGGCSLYGLKKADELIKGPMVISRTDLALRWAND
ncbi:MAG: hypothetical protein IJ303_06370 [Clostridia bacterium]|nr:hypothetical protein [Clostridia bacterium]